MCIHRSRRAAWSILVAACAAVVPPALPAAGAAQPEHPCPIPADLWVLGGQSNMCYLGYRSAELYDRLPEKVHLDPRRVQVFGLDNRWTEPHEPVHWFFHAQSPAYLKAYRGHRPDLTDEQFEKLRRAPRPNMEYAIGPGTAFARHIIRHTDRNIGLIPCALGGSSMAMWDPAHRDDPMNLYGAMLQRIRMIGGPIKGILWNQGESDASVAASRHYKEAMLNFIDQVRRDTGRPDLPIIYVQLGRTYGRNPATIAATAGIETVREAQRQIALERANAFVIGTMDVPFEEGSHVSCLGQQLIGRRMAEVALSEVYHVAGHGRSINLASVRVTPGTGVLGASPVIHLHFSGVTGRLRTPGGDRTPDFELRLPTPPAADDPCAVRTEFDPDDPAGLLVHVEGPFKPGTKLYYGGGLKPYCNLVDETGILVPAFGPVELAAAPGTERMGEIKAFMERIVYSRKEVSDFIHQTDFPFSRYDSLLGYLHRPRMFPEGIDGSNCVYTYDANDARHTINHAGKPCRINTYGDSFTSCEQVNDGETWQEYLAAHLGEPVRNYGIGGYSLYQAYLRMRREENRQPAQYVIVNVFEDDHGRSLIRWHRTRFYAGKGHKAFHTTCPFVKVDPDRGYFEECANICPTPESLYHLSDVNWVTNALRDDFIVNLTLDQQEALAQKTGVKWEARSKEGIPSLDISDPRYLKASLYASRRVVDLIEAYARRHDKKVLYILSYGGTTVAKHLKGERRFDQAFVDYLKEKKLPYVDLLEAHAADYAHFKGDMDAYLKRYFVGHYSPAGNFFCAFATREKLVKLLEPKPITYRVKGPALDAVSPLPRSRK